MNIIDPILFHCRFDPEAPAFCLPGVEFITYARLEKSINNVVRRARATGLLPGHIVALYMPNNQALHAMVMLGLTRMGVVTATVGSRKLPASLPVDAILSEGPYPFPGVQTVPVDASWLEGDGTPAAPDHVCQGNDVCRVILTSGTTGEPKGAALTHNMILGRIMRYYSVFGNGMPSCSRIFCDMTLSTSIGYTFFIYALSKGGAFYMRGANPEITLRVLRLQQVQGLVAAPAGLAELIGHYDAQRCTHKFDAIFSTGSMLSKTLADNVRMRLGPSVISGYGSTEAGQIATAPAAMIGHVRGAVGYVAPGMTVEIVGEDGKKRKSDEEGFVRLRGDYMITRYIGDSENSGQFFRDGWFYPGDMGSLTRDGLLSIAGREKNIMNLGGEKVKPEFIEDMLAANDASLQVGVFLAANELGADEIWAAMESLSNIDEDRLREQCRKYLPDLFIPKRFIPVTKLPRNEMGKLDRRKLADIGKAHRRI